MTASPETAKPKSTYDKANDAGSLVSRASLILKGIDLIIMDQLGGTQPGLPFEAAEIVWELVNVTQTILKEATDVTGEVSFDLSGAGSTRAG